MTFYSRDTEALRQKLQKALGEKDFIDFRAWVESVSSELNVDYLDCAAALAYLWQSGLQKKSFRTEKPKVEVVKIPTPEADIKMVRYRLEIGKQHKVTVEDIKKMLVDETGVERKLIGYIDIHNHFTLIRLPEGMPADIFTHLRSLEINQQTLNIKRIRGNRNSRPGRRKNMHSGNKKKQVSRGQGSSSSVMEGD